MFTELTDATYAKAVANTTIGLILCKKHLCPHCKNMAKVIEKFSAAVPGLTYYSIDSQESEAALVGVGAQRVPTICVIKNGVVTGTKSGLMNPRELEAFFRAAVA